MIVGPSLQIQTAQTAFFIRAIGGIEESSQVQQYVLPRRVMDRVKASLPETPVELAQPVRIPLELGGPGLSTLMTLGFAWRLSDEEKFLSENLPGYRRNQLRSGIGLSNRGSGT
jgi:hypothetical protein